MNNDSDYKWGCEWGIDDADGSVWKTGCDNLFVIISGTPSDNDFRFCMYCGRPLVEAEGETK